MADKPLDKTIPDPGQFTFTEQPESPPTPHAPPLPLDTRPDGIDTSQVLPAAVKGAPPLPRPEFALATRVLYVNGINSNDAGSRSEALAFANATNHSVELVHVSTHGMAADLGAASRETLDPRFTNAAERGIAHEVLSLATAGKDVHIVAYSRGALVAERGLERARSELQSRGLSAEEQRKILSHVTLETVNGASHNVPDGVRSVHYVREADAVSQGIGMGPMAPLSRAVMAGVLAIAGDFNGPVAEVRDGVLNHPSGPIIEVPPLATLNPIDQHLFPDMLKARQPFASAYAPYERERSVHPHPAPGLPPPEHELRQASAPLTPVAEPSPRPERELHVFQDGHKRTVGEGHRQSGKVYNHGPLIGMTHENAGYPKATMYSRHELLEHTPPEHRAALGAALRDGHTVELDLGKHGVGVRDVTPKHALTPSLQQQRAVAPDRGDGLSR